MKLSEAVLKGDIPLTNKLVKKALTKFAEELAEERTLRRTHLMPKPSGGTDK